MAAAWKMRVLHPRKLSKASEVLLEMIWAALASSRGMKHLAAQGPFNLLFLEI